MRTITVLTVALLLAGGLASLAPVASADHSCDVNDLDLGCIRDFLLGEGCIENPLGRPQYICWA